MSINIKPEVGEILKNIIEWRRHIHTYPELGMEAIWKIEVEDFPAFIVTDDKGNDFFLGENAV